MVIMSVLVATFTAPVNIIIDFLFNEILSAPTADDEKKVALALQEGGRARQALRRASNAVRRASAASLQAVTKVKSRAFSTFAIQSTRSIPKDTVAAQAEAAMLSEEFSRSAKIALDSSEELTQVKRSKSLETIRMRKQTRKTIARRENYQPDDGNGIIEERMMEFEADLAEQRKVLKQSLREGFDLKWGCVVYKNSVLELYLFVTCIELILLENSPSRSRAFCFACVAQKDRQRIASREKWQSFKNLQTKSLKSSESPQIRRLGWSCCTCWC